MVGSSGGNDGFEISDQVWVNSGSTFCKIDDGEWQMSEHVGTGNPNPYLEQLNSKVNLKDGEWHTISIIYIDGAGNKSDIAEVELFWQENAIGYESGYIIDNPPENIVDAFTYYGLSN